MGLIRVIGTLGGAATSLPSLVTVVGRNSDDVTMCEFKKKSAIGPEPGLHQRLMPDAQSGPQRARRTFEIELLLSPRRRGIRESGVDPKAPRHIGGTLLILRELKPEASFAGFPSARLRST